MIHISTSFALLVVAIIILVCIAGSRLSGRLGVPTLFIFIMLGMLFGSDGIFKIPIRQFCTGGTGLLGGTDFYYVLRRVRHALE